jgi:tetratricopeptide (TPR) repeat protein
VGLFAKLSRYLDDVLLLPEEAREHAEAAQRLLDQGHNEAALSEATSALQMRDDHPQLVYLAAEALRRLDEHADAERMFREALELDSEHAPARVGLARLLRAQGKTIDAADELRKAAPHLVGAGETRLAAEVLAELAECHLSQQRPDRAARELRKAISLGIEDARLHARLSQILVRELSQPESARAAVVKAIELVAESDDGPLLVEVGTAALTAGLSGDATRLFGRALELGQPAHLQIGRALLAQGDAMGAHEHALRAVAENPSSAEPHRLRAELALSIDDHAAALSALETAVSVDPNHVETLLLALKTASRVGLDRAGPLSERLLAIRPHDPLCQAIQARVRVSRGEIESASRALDRLAESSPGLADVWLGQAELALARRDGEAALTALERLEAVGPNRPELDRLGAQACRLVATAGLDVDPDLFDVLERTHGLLAGRSDLSELGVEVGRIREDYDKPLLLTVMGEFNAGKSTFINALVGEPVAPMGITPTTATINLLKYGPERKVRVFHRSGTVKELEYEALAGWLKSLSRQVAAEVRQVEILYPAEFLTRVNLVDTPGFNSIVPEHETVARQFIERADAVVWLFDAGQPGKESERAALARVTEQGKRAMGVLNKADRLDPESLTKVIEHLKQEELAEHVEDVIALSARRALEAKKGEVVDSEALEASGLPGLERALEDRFYSQARLIKRQGCANRLVSVLAQAIDHEARANANLRRAAESLDMAGRGVAKMSEELVGLTVEHVGENLERIRRAVSVEAATEVLEFVRPRRHLLDSHRFNPEDRRYLLSLVEERLRLGMDRLSLDLAEMAANRIRLVFVAVDQPGIEELGLPEAEREGRAFGTAVTFGLSAFLRGLARGGRAERFFGDELPRIDLDHEDVARRIARWWDGAEEATKDLVEASVSELSRRLQTRIEAEASRLRTDLARQRRGGARPLAGFAALARTWVDGS